MGQVCAFRHSSLKLVFRPFRPDATFAEASSRSVERILSLVGFEAPSRSFLEKRGKEVAIEMGAHANELDEQCRAATDLPATITAVSCGMDRMAVRMSEPVDAALAPKPAFGQRAARSTPSQHSECPATIFSVVG